MKRFENMAAQGDMLIRRIDSLPKGLKSIPSENGKHILTHSESGHHHVVMERPGIQHFSGMDVLRSYLVVPEGEEVDLVHERDHDTHETIRFGAGTYEILRQREAEFGDSWRMAAD
jgi:hypothetical protein